MKLFNSTPVSTTEVPVTKLDEVKPGDMLATGTFTHAGVENYAVVTHFSPGPSTGFYARFCDPKDRDVPRLSDDREFFVWDFEVAAGKMRRVDTQT